MALRKKRRGDIFLIIILILVCICVSACSYDNGGSITSLSGQQASEAADTSRYLIVVDDEPDTVDFQCTSIYYVVALNVFDRLVEMQTTEDGDVKAVPALAESWEVSGDGLVYTYLLCRSQERQREEKARNGFLRWDQAIWAAQAAQMRFKCFAIGQNI